MPQTDVPGEKTSPTQPFPTKPPAVLAQRTSATDDVIDFTPALRAQALENLKKFRWEQTPFVPPRRSRTTSALGSINIGNTDRRRELAGLGVRSGDRHLLHAGEQLRRHRSARYDEEEFDAGPRRELRRKPHQPRWEAEPDYGCVAATHRRRRRGRRRRGAGRGAAPARRQRRRRRRRTRRSAQGLDGLPIVKPPYGVIVGDRSEQRRR